MKEKCKMKVLVLTAFLFLSNLMFAQQKNISGTVTDSKGEPIIGASILAKGSTSGTITDLDGKFTLGVPSSTKVLVVSYVGMKTQEVSLSGSTVKVVLEDDAKSLDDVVVIGYGSKVRANLTGSVGSVSGAALSRVPVSSAAEALQGKVAGVQVTSVDGAPGSEINIRVRGGTSVTQSNAPLFIVDGFPVSSISDIPPTDIQSIDVLKDASLTAIYGAKGGNGVVIVTTKSAKAGKVQVSFNHTTQFRTLARKIDVMDPCEFVKVQYEAAVSNSTNRYKFRKNFGNPLDFDLYKRFGEGNDWQGDILGGAPISQMYNLTINGGTQGLKFNTSVTHNNEKGVLTGSGIIRTSANTKISAELSKKVKLMLNPRINYRQTNGSGADAVGSGGIVDVLRYRPTNGLRDFSDVAPEMLDPEEEKYFQYTNPKNYMDQNYQQVNNYDFTNQATFEWNILKGLTFRSEAMLGLTFYDQNKAYGYLTSTGRSNGNLPVAEITNKKSNRYQLTNVLTYGFSKGESNYSVLLGQEIQHTQTKIQYLKNRYFDQNIDLYTALQNMNLGTPWVSLSSISSPIRTASFFGQVSYDYAHKYLFSATMRADGSTKFSPGNQWGYFPALSGAWVMSKEGFMQNQDVVSQLKLRLAVGMAGNNNIEDDMWRYQYVMSSTGGPGWDNTNITSSEPFLNNSGGSTLPNPDIKWETTLTRNFAVDLGLFNDRITITPEVYWNTTTDLLYESNIMTTTGYTKQMQNIGQVTNRGMELTINGTIVNKKDFQLSANFTFGANKTRIDKLNGSETEIWTTSDRWKSSDSDYAFKVGDEIGLIYGYVYDGIYGFDEFDLSSSSTFVAKSGTVNCDAIYGTAPGKPKFKNIVDGVSGSTDVNIVDVNDRVVIGNTNPDFTGGFGINGAYKAFDFSCNFNFMYGFDVNNATRYTLSSFENNANNYYNVLPEFGIKNRWRYASDNGEYLNSSSYIKQYQETNASASLFNPVDITKKITQSYFIEDGSFLRLQDVTIGYTIPKTITKKVGIDNLRVYFSGYNLFVLTNYTGYDPEVDVQTGLTPGVDYNRYPRSRNFVFGLNLTL